MMRLKFLAACTSVCVLVAASGTALAGQRPRVDFDTYTQAISMGTGHPNELARWNGLSAYSNGRDKAAREYFERAASYADKPSQYLLSLMNWAGDGGSKDPVEAYIWADLAAERGNNQKLLVNREFIWKSLTDAQRKSVETLGPKFYSQYGDASAMPRANAEIGRFSRSRTGSRAGGDTMKMNISFGAGHPMPRMETEGTVPEYARSQGDFYAEERVNPKVYWAQQDVALRGIVTGRVTAGDLQEVKRAR